MRYTTGFWLLLCTFILCACQASQGESIRERLPDVPDEPPITIAPATPGKPAANQPTPTVTALALQPAATIIQEVEQAEARRQNQICSPLVGFGLEELPEIVSSPYAPPPPGREERHHGVDFSFYRRGENASIEGVGVQTVLAGRVAAVIHNRFPYGNMIIVETPAPELSEELRQSLQMGNGESLYILYAHMAEEPEVELGELVPTCYPLGKVGKSGNAGVAHLHIETRLGPAGAQFTGMAYYLVQSTQEERENYERWRTSGVFRHFDPLNLLTQTAR